MAYEQRPGQFALFKNDKRGNEKAPDYTGDGLDLSGKPIKVAAWLKDGKKGKFMSCNIQAKTRGESERNPQQEPSDDDSIPF